MTDNNEADDNDSTEPFSKDEFIELALEYRDELLRDLGVTGTEHGNAVPQGGEIVRRLPVESVTGHDGLEGNISAERILIDVRDYDTEADREIDEGSSSLMRNVGSEIATDEKTIYLTVRQTTGYAAIESSASLRIGWSTVPTPREVRLAEYLGDISERSLRSDWHYPAGVSREDAAERLIEFLFPTRLDRDERGHNVWIGYEESGVDNVSALRSCVCGVVNETEGRSAQIRPIRYQHNYGAGDGEPSSQWTVEFGRSRVAVESHPQGWAKPSKFSIWMEGLGISGPDGWVELEGSSNGVGFLDVADPEGYEIETTMYMIPEFRRPEEVLGLPRAEPKTPYNYRPEKTDDAVREFNFQNAFSDDTEEDLD